MKLFSAVFLFFFTACTNNPVITNPVADDNNPAPTLLQYNIVKVYPHDTSSFTEGLYLYNDALYESTGNKGESKLRKITLETGKPQQEINLDTAYFGEGISMINNKIYQLTYKEHKVFIYDAATFKKLNELQWPFEGWGMTTDGKQFIISTGSSNLYFVNPDDFKILKTLSVTDNNGPVGNINELELINGNVYANVWGSNDIIKINLETGRVESKIDLTGIFDKTGTKYSPNIDVLNGIAYNSAKNSLYITGKYWPALFEIKLN